MSISETQSLYTTLLQVIDAERKMRGSADDIVINKSEKVLPRTAAINVGLQRGGASLTFCCKNWPVWDYKIVPVSGFIHYNKRKQHYLSCWQKQVLVLLMCIKVYIMKLPVNHWAAKSITESLQQKTQWIQLCKLPIELLVWW